MNNIHISKNKKTLNDLTTDKSYVRSHKDSLDPRLLAKQVLIRGESRKEFYDFVAQVCAETLIETKTQEELLKKYIFSTWKLRRLRELERHTINQQQSFTDEEELFDDKKRRIRNLKRVEMTNEVLQLNNQQEKLEKQMDKALRRLREEQKIISQQIQ